MNNNNCVMVVDDERGICNSIESILKQEGFKVHCFQLGLEFIKQIALAKELPNYILLDIWMPDIDGNSVLKKLQTLFKKTNKPFPKIIVMSGHVDSNASSELIKNGSSFFLEKPFTKDQLLGAINKKITSTSNKKFSEVFFYNKSKDFFSNKLVEVQPSLIKQKTLKSAVVKKGTGIHSGSNTGIILSPLQENSGIVFQEISTDKTIPAQVNFISSTKYSTSLQNNGFSLSVVEHLLSALHGYGITNVKIKTNKEIPILDGSALLFCKALDEAGVVEQNGKQLQLVIKNKVTYKDPTDALKFISIEPYNGLYVSYNLYISEKFGSQSFAVDLSNNFKQKYLHEIAPCRTFGFLEETKKLQSSGFAKGATLDNSLLLHENKVINGTLKFPNEFARHKVLDLLGDFYLLNGFALKGKIVAQGTGHRHNYELLKMLFNPLT